MPDLLDQVHAEMTAAPKGDLLDQVHAEMQAKPRTMGDSISDAAGTFWERIGGKTMVDLLGGASRDPARAAKAKEALSSIIEGVASIPKQTWDALGRTGREMVNLRPDKAAYELAGAVPIVGPAAQQITQDVAAGNYAKAIGGTAALAAPIVAPAIAEGATVAGRGVASAAGKAAELVKANPGIAVDALRTVGAAGSAMHGNPLAAAWAGAEGLNLVNKVRAATAARKEFSTTPAQAGASPAVKAVTSERTPVYQSAEPAEAPVPAAEPMPEPAPVQPVLPSGRTPGPAPVAPVTPRPPRRALWEGLPDAEVPATPDVVPIVPQGHTLPSGRVPGRGVPAPAEAVPPPAETPTAISETPAAAPNPKEYTNRRAAAADIVKLFQDHGISAADVPAIPPAFWEQISSATRRPGMPSPATQAMVADWMKNGEPPATGGVRPAPATGTQDLEGALAKSLEHVRQKKTASEAPAQPSYQLQTQHLGPTDYMGGEDPVAVAQYRETIRNGGQVPPVEGVYIPPEVRSSIRGSGAVNIVDGFHRAAAAKAEGVPVQVILQNEKDLTPAQRSEIAGLSRTEAAKVAEEPAPSPPPKGGISAADEAEAFRQWRNGHLYVDGNGNYRLRGAASTTGPVAPWNKGLKAKYADVAALRAAIQAALGPRE